MESVQHTGYHTYDVRKFAGGQLEISADTVSHGNHSNVDWTLGVIFLDDNDYPTHKVSDTGSSLSTLDNPNNIFNTVVLLPHITSSTNITNFSETIDVPLGARKMVWFTTRSYYTLNSSANISAGDKFLLTYRVNSSPIDSTFYWKMYTLKSLISDVNGSVVKNKDESMYGADFMLSNKYTNHPYTTNPNNYRLVNRLKTDSDGTVRLQYQSKYPEREFISLTNVNVMGSSYANQPPVVNVGDSTSINDGGRVFLEGSAIDPDGDAISLKWTCETDPSIIINDDTTSLANVDINLNLNHYDNPSDLVFKLVATDIVGNISNPGYVTVSVNPPLNRPPTTEPYLEFTDIEGGSTGIYIDDDTIDPDGDLLTYQWTQISGPELIISDATAKDIEVTFPVIQSGSDNESIVEGIITDIGGLSVKRTYKFVINTLGNQKPTVYAGEDVTVDSLTVVTLYGTIFDPDNTNLNYNWSQVSGPTVELRTDPQNPRNRIITTPQVLSQTGNTILVFRLSVNDGVNPPVFDEVSVTVNSKENLPPIIQDDQTFNVVGGTTELFEDNVSHDPDGDVLSYRWEQISGPTLTIDDVNNKNINVTFPTITYGQDNISVIEATIDDGIVTNKLQYTFIIQTEPNQAPIIQRKINVSSEVFEYEDRTITRSIEAFDPDGQTIKYNWNLIKSELDSGGLVEPWIGTINYNQTQRQLSFTMPKLEPSDNTHLILLFEVTVDDGELYSAPETFEIIINAPKVEITPGNIYYDEIEDAIIVDNTINKVSFVDIKNAIDLQLGSEQTKIKSFGDRMFLLEPSLMIINGSFVADTEVSLTILGSRFIIDAQSSFQLGKLTDLDTTIDGAYLSMPNIAQYSNGYYSFGGGDKSNSGNIYLYGCRVDIWTFWGFFRGEEQVVHILDCVVRGFGRIEGTNTRVRNITFEEAHRVYGILSYKGDIEEYDDIVIQKSTGAAFYFNHLLVNNPLIIKNIEVNNYQNLVYCSDRADSDKVIQFLDSEINGTYSQTHNITNNILEIAYTFNPVFTNSLFEVYQNVQIDITDELNNVVFTGLTDDNGEIDTILIIKRIEDNVETYSSTIFNIRLTKGDKFVDYIYEHDLKPWIKKPIYLRDPILEPLSTPVEPPPNPGEPGFEIVISPDASIVIYSSAHTHDEMEEQKEYIYSKIPESDKPVTIYTDRARHAYDPRPSYENMVKRALRGEIKKIYTYEEETFGPTRKGITIDLLVLAGIEVVYTVT